MMTPGDKDAICQRSLAIVNAKSASAAAQDELLRAFEAAGGAVCSTSDQGELADVFGRAQAERRTRLIVVGGDGSLSCMVNALGPQSADYEIAIVPAGTGNDFARALLLPVDDPALAWEIALRGSPVPVDVVEMRGRKPSYFINTITGGFGGRQAADVAAEQKSSWGKIAYWLAAAIQLGDMPEFDLSLTADGREECIRCLGFWLANGRYTGGGFPVAPDALLDDGMLDLVVVPSMPVLELFAAGVDFTLIGPQESSRLMTLRTAELTLKTATPIPLSIDGDPVDCDALECHVLRHALRIIAGNIDPAEGSGVAADEE